MNDFLFSPTGQFIGVWLTLIFFFCTGVIDAVLWSKTGAAAFKFNEHTLLVFVRGCFLLISIIPVNWVLVLCTWLMFPAIHNGAYYMARNAIDGSYPKKWKAEPSDSSTATINFSFKLRTALAFIGFLLISAIFIFHLW